MGDKEPNEKQEDLINSLEGIYLVDAGAGTGKTFALTRRYSNLIETKDMNPEDVLLITFTDNAAQQMKEKAIEITDCKVSRMREAPISTFHSYCQRLLEEEGQKVPQILGINDSLSSSIRIIENKVQEQEEFDRFYNRFKKGHEEHKDFYHVLGRKTGELLNLIKSLGAKGIFPKEEGWFGKTEQYLKGDYQQFKQLFEEVNQQRGNSQSRIRGKLSSFTRDKCYGEDAPTKEEARGPRGTKIAEKKYFEQAFEENREDLFNFVHDLFFEYLEYCLGRDYLNFSFLQVLAFVLLMENDRVRDSVKFDYVMADEFQDTSEIQFKLMMLLAGKNNICAVGDWKQSIFSFQYANVENILDFKQNLVNYKNEVNQNQERIGYSVEDVEEISLDKNYRSSQSILDFSEKSLTLKAQDWERLNIREIEEKITSLDSSVERKNTLIKAFKANEEKEAILSKIGEIVDNPDYKIEDENDNLRKIKYSDIAVLSRTKKFGLELQKKADEFGIPVAYEGGIRLFETDPAIILLAWLRVLKDKTSKRGWSVLLEQIGYNFFEIENILEEENYPENLLEFYQEIKEIDDVSTLSREIFDQYGLQGEVPSKIIEVIDAIFSDSYMELGKLVEFIEKNIEEGTTYDIDSGSSRNVVKVQTIHKAKGLEYPVVFVSNLNERKFPIVSQGSGKINYTDVFGLRQRKIYHDSDLPFLYDNWKYDFLAKCKDTNYDEERRLLYVAMTRARNYLYLTAEEGKEGNFIENLDIDVEIFDQTPEKVELEEGEEEEFVCQELEEEKRPIKLPVHAIMKEVQSSEGRGKEFGTKVHNFAEKVVRKTQEDRDNEESKEEIELEADNKDKKRVKNFLLNLSGELRSEEKIMVPYQVGNRKVVLSGVIDLLNIRKNEVEIIDFKTDETKDAEEEYRKQLSVYYHGISQVFPEKKVSARIFYTFEDKLKEIDPFEREEFKQDFRRI